MKDVYIVVIDGYEGIESIFGFFDKKEAEKFAIELKKSCNTQYTSEDTDKITLDKIINYYKKEHSYLESDIENVKEQFEKCPWEEKHYYLKNKLIKEINKRFNIKMNTIAHSDQICIMGIESKNSPVIECICKQFKKLPKQAQWWH